MGSRTVQINKVTSCTLTASPAGVRVEWHPRRPIKLSITEIRKVRAARAALLDEQPRHWSRVGADTEGNGQ
jgi:hypothetical protein